MQPLEDHAFRLSLTPLGEEAPGQLSESAGPLGLFVLQATVHTNKVERTPGRIS